MKIKMKKISIYLKSKYNFYNVKCNRQLIYLKNELELLKDKSTKSKEKMTLFIKLVKKYAKKLLTLSKLLPLNTNMNNNENNIFIDIYNTINQFNQMIFNPKLNENIFEISDLLTTEDSVKHNLINDSPFTLKPNKENEIENENYNVNYNDNLNEHYQNLIRKYEEKFKLLISENDSLRKYKEIKNNEKNKYEKEILNLEEKLKKEKNINEELLNKYNSINDYSQELQNKNQYLQNENLIYKKKINELNEEINKYDTIINKNEMLVNDINYKSSIIKYLENLLKRTNLNPKLFTEQTYKEEYQKEKTINNENEYNLNEYLMENNQNDSMSDYNNNYNNINNQQSIQITQNKNLSMKKDKISSFENNKINDEEDLQLIRPFQIKKEIDNLDDEIYKLQSKLKKILNK